MKNMEKVLTVGLCNLHSSMAMFIFIISLVMILSTNRASPFCQGARSGRVLEQEEQPTGFTVERRLQALDDSTTSSSTSREISSHPAEHRLLRNEAFSSINRRRHLAQCNDPNPYIGMTIDASGSLADVQNVTVTVNGVLSPDSSDWIGIMSPMTANGTDECLSVSALYIQTGDTSSNPYTCHYPVKYQKLENDPQYTSCNKSTCQQSVAGHCLTTTCSGSLTFRLINIRTDITFVFFTGGFLAPCVLNTSAAIPFANPKSPLYGHLSSVDSTATKMRLTWVSGDSVSQQVTYNGASRVNSSVSTFTASQMSSNASNPANDFGWHDPGYIHTAVMTGLTPSTSYSYSYGSASAGWSTSKNFTTLPAAGASSVRAVIYGDMGKGERDNSSEHYVNPGAIGVNDALAKRSDMDLVLHIGDISYATGFMVEWDSFLELVNPVASRVSYMTAIGNHERDFPDSGSVYTSKDSGGEIGVPYEAYFPMPTSAADKPWYSFGSGPVHFTVMSTEHNWTSGSEQYNWITADLAAVNRTITPWIVFTGHRPAYSSYTNIINLITPAVDSDFAPQIEPLLLNAKVDFVVWGHVHNYERTCAVYSSTCLGSPTKNSAGIDTYNSANYTAPVHVVIGTAGYTLDDTDSNTPPAWSLVRIKDYGYSYLQANTSSLSFQFISTNGTVGDQFQFSR